MPYVEILNDLELVESSFYDKIKYGTSDAKMIKLLKEGFSIELAKVIKTGIYDDYINLENDLIVNNNNMLIILIRYY